MKNDHPEITTLPYTLDNGETIEYPISCIETERLLDILETIVSWDFDCVAPVMAELCERGGLDLADYMDCDDCYNALLHEFDIRKED